MKSQLILAAVLLLGSYARWGRRRRRALSLSLHDARPTSLARCPNPTGHHELPLHLALKQGTGGREIVGT
jgi:hypothetical protein